MFIKHIQKYAVVAAIMLVVGFAAPSANAQSTAALQQQINQLLAQIAALQAQLGGITGTCNVTFTQSMGIGASGPQVLALQQFLNRDPDTRLAVSGAGSPGFETQYYGPITANAVSRFQAKYRTEILTPLGLANPTGYFGPSSIAKANALCTVVVPPPADDDDDDDDQDRDLEGGEAVLRDFEVDDGDDTSLSEGQSNAPVMDVEFEVTEGDIEIDRIDVALDHVTGGDDEPWDIFETISIWVDDDMIAEMDVDDEDVWSENEPESGDFTVRMAEIDHIVRENDMAEFTVALTVAGSVDDAENELEWQIFIPDDGIRTMDSLGLSHYIGDTDDSITIEINEEGGDDELVVRNSDADPDASTLQLDENGVSDWLTVFAFALDADDSSSDIEITSIPVLVEFSDSLTYNALVNDARLVVDGEEYDDFEVQDGNTDEATLVFDLDGDLVVDAGEGVDVELQLEFEALADDDEGTTVQASIDSSLAEEIEAEGADDLDADQIGGSATGETHTLRTGGVSGDGVETDTELRTNSDSTPDDDEGVFTVEFEVTAFEQDIYFNKSATRGTTQGTNGANYVIEDSGGDVTASGDAYASLTSSADSVGSRYVIREGETESIKVTVVYDPATSGFYNLQLYSINYNDTAADPDSYQRLLPESTFETDPLSI